MEREWTVEESVRVAAPPDEVYAAVADLRRMPEWSPELFRVWIRGGGEIAEGTRFVGFNRLGWRVWFTTCEVTAAIPGRAFAFRVTTFGMPVALWGYRIEGIEAAPGEDAADEDATDEDGSAASTRLAEYWEDLRRDSRSARVTALLGRVFTGVRAEDRAELNRRGMRATLARIRTAIEH
ncbi:SRPBCC family protein [Actinomadura logoneensis]|uniref:SRPBCC family protein n=1 Tax=Actinomadura logoneensis TaxID=2293572 RepID=A0A372JS66_9ACTN|nr:SRPBCC family protein [Actinomadura logoneensis]RFU42857.1 SRPBCC family protein [Actinomadura logoneensis]